MSGFHMSASRTVPVPVERAFDTVLPEPLPRIFTRRYGPLGAIKETPGQAGVWGSSLGKTRTIVLSDGATMTETLVSLDRPTSFGYRITDLTGPFKFLVSSLDGEWGFAPAGTGCRITWSWTLHEASAAARLVFPLFARFWRGYARQALEEIEKILV